MGKLSSFKIGITLTACLACGTVQGQQPRTKPAPKAAAQAAEDPAKGAEALFEAGQTAHAAGQLEKAIELYAEAIAKDSSLWQAGFQRSAALLSLKRYAEARAGIGQVLDVLREYGEAPEAREVRSRAEALLGEAELAEGRGAEAEAAFRRAIALNPKSGRAHAGLAEALLQTGKAAEAAGAARAALDEAIDLSRNRIAALIGAGPDRGDTLPRPAFGGMASPDAPANLALDLLGRRPDIVAARLRTEAAAKRVKVAKLDFYPNINISATAGLQSLGLSKLFEGGSSTANFGPAISLPLFDGGRLAGRYRAAGAAYDEAVARYNATLIGAFREVADTLDSRRALTDRLSATAQSSAAAERAAELAKQRYRAGVTNLLQALAAEDAALAALRSKTELEARARMLDITLTRALGGGFHSPSPKDKAGS